MFFTIKLYLHLNCIFIVRNRTIFIKMDLPLNNLQRLICDKTQPTNITSLFFSVVPIIEVEKYYWKSISTKLELYAISICILLTKIWTCVTMVLAQFVFIAAFGISNSLTDNFAHPYNHCHKLLSCICEFQSVSSLLEPNILSLIIAVYVIQI